MCGFWKTIKHTASRCRDVCENSNAFCKRWPTDGHVCLNSNCHLQFIVCQPRKKNFRFLFPLAPKLMKFVVYIFCLQQINVSCRFLLVLLSLYIYIYIQYAAVSNQKWKTDAQAIFLNPFMVCSLCKWKFVVCPFVDNESNGNYPFAHRLKELNRQINRHAWRGQVNHVL